MVNLDPRYMVGRIDEGDYQTLLHTKHIEALGLVVLKKNFFFVFPIVSLWELSVAMETTILIHSAPKPDAVNPPTQ